MNISYRTYFLSLLALMITSMLHALGISGLQCDYRVDPLGVDTKTPRLSWKLVSSEHDVVQKAYQVLVADDSTLLTKGIGNIWDSKKQNSKQSIQVVYAGKPLQAAKKYFWKVKVWDNKGKVSSWSNIANWQMGLLSKADWNNASWIGYEKLPEDQKIIPAAHGNGEKSWGKRPDVLPLLRKEFAVNKKLKSATAFVSGLGQFELYINSNKVGDHFLDPGWTMYNKEALYVSFDVTSMLTHGGNAIGAMLGNGFYYIPGERYRKMTGAFGYPKMICRVVINYTDGSTDNIITDETWKTHESPIYFSSMYGGESYDANKEQIGWAQAGFDDGKWKTAVSVDAVPELQSQTAAPVKLFDTLSPKSVNKFNASLQVYDMGQNAAAIPFIEVTGSKGDTVKIIPGELLDSTGHVSQRSSGGPYYFLYVLKGDGVEKWHPRFTYYGYRYLQVETIAKESGVALPVVNAVKSVALHADYPNVGSFTCSNELFNKTERLIDWAIRSNMQSIFTDCPHRERLGWQEQLHLMGPSFHYSYDISSYGEKLMTDIGYAQQSNGLIPSTIPEFTEMHFADGFFRDSPEWGSSGIIMPWNLYRWYGDLTLLSKSYFLMKSYLDYLSQRDSSDLLMYGLSDWYDLGPQRPGFAQLTPMGLTATAIYYHDLTIMKTVAGLLHRTVDSIGFANKASDVKKAFNRKYFTASSNQYGSGSQTSNAIALYMDLIAPEHKKAVLNNLVSELRTNDYRLTAGDIGYRYLLRVLADNNQHEVIYKMNNRSDVPGYGYQLAKGATALTESWNASGIVSNNHFMLGHILEWFYADLAGIRQQDDAVAYDKILIAPVFNTEVSEVNASFDSPYGMIKSQWEKNADGKIKLQVTIPANTTAKLQLPFKKTASYSINKKSYPSQRFDIKEDKATISVGSGTYEIIIKDAL